MTNLNWRKISDVGLPTDRHADYFVTDGKSVSVSAIHGMTKFRAGSDPVFTFMSWAGDDNVYEDNDCCSGTKILDMDPTHWCPVNEINLPTV